MKKEMIFGLKIINRTRFITFISIILAFTTFLITGSLTQTSVHSQIETTYIDINIAQGDTLWEIAQKYNQEGRDVREFIHKIMKKNNLKTAALYESQKLMIPLE